MATAPKQHLMTDGLILREYDTTAEADRFVAILTRDKGLLRASARGAKRLKSRSGAATQPLCYARLSLIPGRDRYIIEDAQPQDVFFPLRQDVEKLALAQYFCELALRLCPTDQPAPDHLRLLLGGLHYLCEDKKDPLLIKAVVEGRLLSLEGYMPDLTGCCRCGKEGGELVFSPTAGTLFCSAHAAQGDGLAVSSGVLAALRHILYGAFERCFAFSLPTPEVAALATLMERFLLAQVQRSFNTLEFYHTLRP
ncbi:MAG: DNA repair protein RecO [Clostridia bacterium]|nr:DNA repair protein RecO [Clostridia bacterium]